MFLSLFLSRVFQSFRSSWDAAEPQTDSVAEPDAGSAEPSQRSSFPGPHSPCWAPGEWWRENGGWITLIAHIHSFCSAWGDSNQTSCYLLLDVNWVLKLVICILPQFNHRLEKLFFSKTFFFTVLFFISIKYIKSMNLLELCSGVNLSCSHINRMRRITLTHRLEWTKGCISSSSQTFRV